jgi:hypothetical protein
VDWTWSWIPYGGGTSFGDNFWFDWLRVACLMVGVVMGMAISRVLIEGQRREVRMTRTQVSRFLALACADIYISFTEFAVFGTPATPRLAFGVGTLVFGVYGVRGMRAKQRAIPPVR